MKRIKIIIIIGNLTSGLFIAQKFLNLSLFLSLCVEILKAGPFYCQKILKSGPFFNRYA